MLSLVTSCENKTLFHVTSHCIPNTAMWETSSFVHHVSFTPDKYSLSLFSFPSSAFPLNWRGFISIFIKSNLAPRTKALVLTPVRIYGVLLFVLYSSCIVEQMKPLSEHLCTIIAMKLILKICTH